VTSHLMGIQRSVANCDEEWEVVNFPLKLRDVIRGQPHTFLILNDFHLGEDDNVSRPESKITIYENDQWFTYLNREYGLQLTREYSNSLSLVFTVAIR